MFLKKDKKNKILISLTLVHSVKIETGLMLPTESIYNYFCAYIQLRFKHIFCMHTSAM